MKNKKTWVVIVVILLFIAGVVALWYFLLRNPNSEAAGQPGTGANKYPPGTSAAQASYYDQNPGVLDIHNTMVSMFGDRVKFRW